MRCCSDSSSIFSLVFIPGNSNGNILLQANDFTAAQSTCNSATVSSPLVFVFQSQTLWIMQRLWMVFALAATVQSCSSKSHIVRNIVAVYSRMCLLMNYHVHLAGDSLWTTFPYWCNLPAPVRHHPLGDTSSAAAPLRIRWLPRWNLGGFCPAEGN